MWFNMLFGDSRDRWDCDGITDPRVAHFWDEQQIVGNWFSANVTHNPGTTWDFYSLYGPDSSSMTSPLNSGGTIISKSTRLLRSIEPLLGITATSSKPVLHSAIQLQLVQRARRSIQGT